MDLFRERTILSVSRLTSLIQGLLEDNFEQIWVEGEVSNLSQPASGHLYFTLKDSSAMVRCVVFRTSAKLLRFKLEDGQSLLVRGRLSLYAQRGEYQIVGEYLEPKGAGALQLAFMQMKDRLSREGLFDQERKLPLPKMPHRVALVTSPTGAAVQDMLSVLARRTAALEIVLYPVRVQGDGAAREIAVAITDLNRLQAADVIIAGRGGGSPEDLWAFNEEEVARAIAASRIPVISAVGHETDWSISDFVADLRAPTPSAAAELVCTSRDEIGQLLDSLRHRLYRAQSAQVEMLRRRLEGLRRALHDPTLLLGHLGQRIDDLGQRLELALKHRVQRVRETYTRNDQLLAAHHPALAITRQRERLSMLTDQADRCVRQQLERCGRGQGEATARLNGLSPLMTLARGYAVVEKMSGGVVRDSHSLAKGERLRVRLQRGEATCLVETTS